MHLRYATYPQRHLRRRHRTRAPRHRRSQKLGCAPSVSSTPTPTPPASTTPFPVTMMPAGRLRRHRLPRRVYQRRPGPTQRRQGAEGKLGRGSGRCRGVVESLRLVGDRRFASSSYPYREAPTLYARSALPPTAKRLPSTRAAPYLLPRSAYRKTPTPQKRSDLLKLKFQRKTYSNGNHRPRSKETTGHDRFRYDGL